MRSLVSCAMGAAAMLLVAAPAPAELVVRPRAVASTGTVRFALRATDGVRKASFAVDGRTVDVDRRAPFACGRSGVLRATSLGAGEHRLTVRVWRGGRAVTPARPGEIDAAPPPDAPPPAPAPRAPGGDGVAGPRGGPAR